MTQRDPEALLELARQALAPRDTDRARVLSALEQRLDLPSNHVENELARSQHHELHSVQASSSGLALGVPSAVLRWALAAIVPLTGVAVVSLVLTARDAAPKLPVLAPAPQITSATTEPSLPDVIDRSIAQVKEVSEPEAPLAPPPEPPKEKKPQRKKCRTAHGSERPCTTVKSSESAIANAPQPPAAAPTSSLSKELSALREAQRALREGDATRALAVLTAFEQVTEGPGAMQEERHAAATMARCALAERGETGQLYESFMQHYPKSAYAARLQRTCLAKSAR